MIRRLLPPAFAIAISLLIAAPALAGFGFSSFKTTISKQDGSSATQAGSHPYAMTTGFMLNEAEESRGFPIPAGNVKDVEATLPPGLIGNPLVTQRCSQQQFTTQLPGSNKSACPDGSAVGVARIAVGVFAFKGAYYFPVYNLVPSSGVAAEFGVSVLGQIPIIFTASVRPGSGYSVTTSFKNISQALVIYGGSVTLWGVPADPAHDHERGVCLGEFTLATEFSPPPSEAPCPTEEPAKPFLTLPSACSGPLQTMIEADSWQEPERWVPATALSSDSLGNPFGINGCERLDFSPSLSLIPQSDSANSPTAVNVDLNMPQNESPTGLGEADLRDTTVALPAGLAVNPSAADGLAACSPEQIAIDRADAPSCPDASKIGSVEVVTPLLKEPLAGAVYLAEQGNNPFKSLLAFYVVVKGDGVMVKLPGQVAVDPLTGQLTTTVKDAPQVPFADFKLNLFGGPRAPLATQACGTYAASASLASWASGTPVSPAIQPFAITESCGGGFAPSFVAGTANNQAGGFSPFLVSFSRTDQDQNFGQVSVHMPQGVLAMLSKVTLCGEPQAQEGTCPASSQIGHVTASAGAGPDPLSVPQPGKPEAPVYLTGPYKGAPFGLSIVVPAQAGPFDLGLVRTRAAIYVDPHTAQVTVVSDPLPRIVQGIPLNIRTINAVIDKEGFTFNPTNCEPLAVTGTVASTQGASANVSAHFQAADCASLPFKPRFTVSTQAHTSKKNGASLDVKVTSGPGQANIGRAVVSLPKQMPSRLTTLQQACPAATFAANPASCPAGSNVGTAKAVTPVLSEPLTGPAYLVSHGGAAFPDLVVILQGQGIRLDLVGGTSIKKSITTSSFTSIPDAPISSFELKLPEGPHSALTTNLPGRAGGNLCGSKLVMPTTLTGQNGAQVTQSTRIAVTGCPKIHARKARARHATAK